jgi:hypothetical protein
MLLTNASLKSLAGVALAFALSAPALYSQSSNTPASAVDFGMIGLAASQTLRLSIIAFPPTPIYPPQPICIAQLGFANSSGGPVGPTKTVNLGPGQGDFLDLNGNSLALPFGGRAEMLPVVTMLPAPGGGTPACLANAEILDSFSGFSLVLAPGATAYPPDPIFPLQGVAWGQVLRLNLVAYPPTPVAPASCSAQLSFVDKSGNPAGPAPKVVNLSQGHADFLDVTGVNLVAQPGQRAELRPVVTMLPGAASVCAATAEVYDPFSGRTWAWGNPSAVVTRPASIAVSGVTVPVGQSKTLNVSLSSPAPINGVTITLSSSDTTVFTVTPSVFIAANQTTPAAPPQVNGMALGSATVFASAGGYTSGNATVSVIPVIDSTPPAIVHQITGTLGNNGWYRSHVTVIWSVTDPESRIASSSGCGQTTLTADTAGLTLTCGATNGAGLRASVPITIKIDQTPPAIAGLPAAGCTLGPANHKLVQVATVTATDALSGLAPGSFKVTATSNEPIDPTDPAIVITPSSSGGFVVQLQADRLGNGTGRVYTLTATANDLAGNAAAATATCTVPHDQGQ